MTNNQPEVFTERETLMRSRIASLQRTLDNLRQQLADCQRQISDWQRTAAEWESRRNTWKAMAHRLRRQRRGYEFHYNELVLVSAMWEARTAEAKAEVERLRAELADLRGGRAMIPTTRIGRTRRVIFKSPKRG